MSSVLLFEMINRSSILVETSASHEGFPYGSTIVVLHFCTYNPVDFVVYW